ncbi:MAG: hypothetical protein A2104_05105 [Candidatus Melainabacteria bacterium GWF2_32_7]|nr:MAG: hypothetical protein A2104_05105 [Candidatus Melainabacteria bacterium GWF2_32_7]
MRKILKIWFILPVLTFGAINSVSIAQQAQQRPMATPMQQQMMTQQGTMSPAQCPYANQCPMNQQMMQQQPAGMGVQQKQRIMDPKQCPRLQR